MSRKRALTTVRETRARLRSIGAVVQRIAFDVHLTYTQTRCYLEATVATIFHAGPDLAARSITAHARDFMECAFPHRRGPSGNLLPLYLFTRTWLEYMFDLLALELRMSGTFVSAIYKGKGSKQDLDNDVTFKLATESSAWGLHKILGPVVAKHGV